MTSIRDNSFHQNSLVMERAGVPNVLYTPPKNVSEDSFPCYGLRDAGPAFQALPITRTFSMVVEAAVTLVRCQRIRVLTFLDDWLVVVESREQMDCHTGFPYSVSGVHSESQEKLFDSS